MFKFLRRFFGRQPTDPLIGLDPARARLIVGLGNPGPEYADTRHNLGFRCVERLAQRYGAAWQDRTDDLHSLVARVHPEADRPLVLAKPHTFMNRSGDAVGALLEQLGIARGQCLVVYDDMDLRLGALRLRERGSPGTHNGMRSVVASLATDAVPRLRIGISQASSGEAISHVLSGFALEERQAVEDLVERAADAALAWAINGAAVAMNRYNKT
ncbi:MAG: aminoacyl-tRNA hydrolase [Chloroflexota bacterium]|nr:aminoacyl-tRNA hydrolase [Chloroflexota bacterium]